MDVAFGNGGKVGLTSEGGSWNKWDIASEAKQTAEVFRFDHDPGALLNGNTLCGDAEQDQTLHVVFYEDSILGLLPTLNVAVFRSNGPPHDIYSEGLCGIFGYEIRDISETLEKRPSDKIAEAGKWKLNKNTNPIDDTTTVVISLTADSGASKYGSPVKFVALCKSNKTDAYVDWGDYLGSDSANVESNWKNVTVRVGTGEARVERWGTSTDWKATFAPNWAGDFLKELLDQDRLVLQTIPYGENPATAIFDISGLRNVLGELAATCNWSF